MLLVDQVYSWFDEAIILFEKTAVFYVANATLLEQVTVTCLSVERSHINNEMRSSVLRDKKSTVSHTL